jgi:hypothetical protein
MTLFAIARTRCVKCTSARITSRNSWMDSTFASTAAMILEMAVPSPGNCG